MTPLLQDPSFLDQLREALRFERFLAWHVWLLFAILMGILEMLTPGFVLACLGVGAVGASLCDFLGWHDLEAQLGVFAILTFLSFFTLRPMLLRSFHSKTQATNVDALVGRHAFILEDSAAGAIARAKLGAEEWRAEAADGGVLHRGDRVRVLRVDGNRLIVEKL